MTTLEAALSSDIADPRFLPYLQLHEFAALLFTDIRGFKDVAEFSSTQPKVILSKIQYILDTYNNPEDINQGTTTAPSKRLISIIPNYEKILFGYWIAEENGLSSILNKCPRFSAWVNQVVQFANTAYL